jgi:hypothetical protein
MVWVYETPPSSKKEKEFHRHLKKVLRSEAHAERTAKLIGLYLFLRQRHFKTAKEIQESAFYDKDHKHPVFDEKTAKKVLVSLKQRGGESNYPFTDTFIRGVLRDYTPGIIGDPVGSIYGTVTGTVDGIKNDIPFADLAIHVLHGTTEMGMTTAADAAEGIGGPIGAAVIVPFTAAAAAVTSAISVLDGDLGQAVAHFANFVPIIGSALGKGMTKTEELAKKLKDHPTIAGFIPYMTEYHDKLGNSVSTPEQAAGKRLSTKKRNHSKWRQTRRRR